MSEFDIAILRRLLPAAMEFAQVAEIGAGTNRFTVITLEGKISWRGSFIRQTNLCDDLARQANPR